MLLRTLGDALNTRSLVLAADPEYAQSLAQFALYIEDAITKHALESYGNCKRCRKPISEKRLGEMQLTEHCSRCSHANEVDAHRLRICRKLFAIRQARQEEGAA